MLQNRIKNYRIRHKINKRKAMRPTYIQINLDKSVKRTNSTSTDAIFTGAWRKRTATLQPGCYSTAPADKQINNYRQPLLRKEKKELNYN